MCLADWPQQVGQPQVKPLPEVSQLVYGERHVVSPRQPHVVAPLQAGGIVTQ